MREPIYQRRYGGNAMTQGAEAPTIGRSWAPTARAFALAHGLALGVTTITAVAATFLLHQLLAWPPHEDETLALFVGRDSLPGLLHHVTRDRGGAPLHFMLAWAVAHAGFGLAGLRLVSAVFAVASLPLVALLATRLAGRRAALVATALVAASWMLLFHGIYARMYSLFLFLALLSFLGLLRALDRGGRAWIGWGAAILLAVAAHPYGALVLAAQGVYVLVARRDRLGAAIVAFGTVVVLGIPFWLTDIVLAGRFDVGVGGGGARLGGPWAIVTYLWQTAGDFSAGWWPVLTPVLLLALLGLVSVDRKARLLALCAMGVPVIAFLAARVGGSASPESRHLIFVLPFFSTLTAAGIVRVSRRLPAVALLVVAGLLVAEVAWAWHRTAPLFDWEPGQRQVARADAQDYLASTSRPDDILFGYEPLFLGAWERNRSFSDIVVPRADSTLALRVLERQPHPLGRGVWVLDASERNNIHPQLEIQNRDPGPPGLFETRAFGPFLVIRTSAPVRSDDAYLAAAARAMLVGRALGIGDADINLQTIEQADRKLRGYGPSLRLRSINSR
jgi:Dolichyl-phosphate-mannose-protein mannosyltransferase